MRKRKIVFSNIIIKDCIEILEDSEYKLVFRTFLESGGGQNQFHYHTKISETFRIISGELSVAVKNSVTILRAGNEFSISPHTNHFFFNMSEKIVIFDVEILNPKKMINALRIMYGLTNDGKINSNGLPNNIFYAAIALNMMDAFSPKVPYIIQKTGILILATLGKILGLEKLLIERYCM